jgi:hypothetical protein
MIGLIGEVGSLWARKTARDQFVSSMHSAGRAGEAAEPHQQRGQRRKL